MIVDYLYFYVCFSINFVFVGRSTKKLDILTTVKSVFKSTTISRDENIFDFLSRLILWSDPSP